MNLIEILTGGVLFTLAASASLQVWSLAAAGSVRDGAQQLRLDRLDAELVGMEGRLRQLARQGELAPSCPEATVVLAERLAAVPKAAGVERQQLPTADGQLLLVQVRLPGEEISRQRLYSPAVLGFCPVLEPVLPEEGHGAR
jgi:hypothetical protein